jgi:hypothetical protein
MVAFNADAISPLAGPFRSSIRPAAQFDIRWMKLKVTKVRAGWLVR